jgi:hypothetical protein
MYPAQALADALYSENDLPDNVIVDGTLFSRSGTNYGNTTNGVILEGNVWAKYQNGIRSQRNCLIQGGVVDEFADTYTFSVFGSPIANIARYLTYLWASEVLIFTETTDGDPPIVIRYIFQFVTLGYCYRAGGIPSFGISFNTKTFDPTENPEEPNQYPTYEATLDAIEDLRSQYIAGLIYPFQTGLSIKQPGNFNNTPAGPYRNDGAFVIS